jgi:hypothetical protein
LGRAQSIGAADRIYRIVLLGFIIFRSRGVDLVAGASPTTGVDFLGYADLAAAR